MDQCQCVVFITTNWWFIINWVRCPLYRVSLYRVPLSFIKQNVFEVSQIRQSLEIRTFPLLVNPAFDKSMQIRVFQGGRQIPLPIFHLYFSYKNNRFERFSKVWVWNSRVKKNIDAWLLKFFKHCFPWNIFLISKLNNVNAWSCPSVACSFNDYGAVGECKENIIQLCVNISNASIESSI